MSLYYRIFLYWATVSLTAVGAQPLHAELLVELNSSPADLSQLSIAESITVDVTLSGLAPGDRLELLAATIDFEGELLGTPTITPGPILPDPLDNPLDFLPFESFGTADGIFLTLGTDQSDFIAGNGLFFSFMVTSQQAGAGTLDISFVSALQYNPSDPLDPIVPLISAGAPLTFQVVPEPTGMMLGLTSLVAFAMKLVGRLWGRLVSKLTSRTMSTIGGITAIRTFHRARNGQVPSWHATEMVIMDGCRSMIDTGCCSPRDPIGKQE